MCVRARACIVVVVFVGGILMGFFIVSMYVIFAYVRVCKCVCL